MTPTAPRHAVANLSALATRLPWWGGLLSALAAYMLLHPISLLKMPTPIGMWDVVTAALGQMFVFLASIGQFLLPLAFLVAAAVSGFNLWKRGDLRLSVTQDTSGSLLRGLPLADFELLVGDAFRRQGYQVCAARPESTPTDRTLELVRDGRRFLVGCSDWRSSKAGVAAVRELHERAKATGAAGGFAVTSGQFTLEARHFAADTAIKLVDGRHLKDLVRAEPPPTQGSPFFDIGELRSVFSRRHEPILNVSLPTYENAPGLEPHIRDYPGGAADADLRAVASAAEEGDVDTEDAETTAGRELTALIRAESRVGEEIELSIPLAQRREGDPRVPRSGLPKIRAAKVVDAIGILTTLGVFWGIYQWFLQLPDSPEDTPWTLLGADNDAEALRHRLHGLGRDGSAAKLLEGSQPLGQYRFGPPPGFLTEAAREIPPQERPIEVYHSIGELERAFSVKYVPPPECYAYESNNLMVKCANHRIRARQTFIENGGQVTATLLGAWAEPRRVMREPPVPAWPGYDQGDWQQESTGEQGQEWQQNSGADSSQGWNRYPGPPSDQGQRPVGTWEPVPMQGQYGPRQGDPWDWQRGYGQGPPPDWRPRPAVPVQPGPGAQPYWRGEWSREPTRGLDSDRQGEWIDQPDPDPAQDSQEGQPLEGEGEWGRAWWSQPLPVERRHWADDP